MPNPTVDAADLELERVTPDLIGCLDNAALDAWLELFGAADELDELVDEDAAA